jgi:hypothetical protein
MEDRHSKAAEPSLITDPEEIARVEARNALRQFDAVMQLVEQWTAPDHPPFKLRASTILALHREALDGLSAYAGTFRPASIDIGGSKHKPVDAFLVPSQVEELWCLARQLYDVYVAARTSGDRRDTDRTLH